MDSLSTDSAANVTSAGEGAEPSRFRRYLGLIGWSYFALFCLLLFTVLKLPEDRVRNYVQAQIAAPLAAKGVTLTPARSWVSFGLGVSYVMQDVVLTLPPNGETVRVDRITLSPSILSLLFRKTGGSFAIENGDGSLDGSFSMKNDGSDFATQLSAKKFNLAKLGVLGVATGFRGGAVVTGDTTMSGNPSIPSTFTGGVHLVLSKVVIEEQNFQGFNVPRMNIADGKIDVDLDKSKAMIKAFRLGPDSGNLPAGDDLQAKLTGDVTLGRQIESSTLNNRLQFRLSQHVLEALGGFLTGMMAGAKQADGSYAYSINGSPAAPNFMPVGAAPAAGAPGR